MRYVSNLNTDERPCRDIVSWIRESVEKCDKIFKKHFKLEENSSKRQFEKYQTEITCLSNYIKYKNKTTPLVFHTQNHLIHSK